MSDAELWAAWRLWMAVAVAVILIAATLLIVIWRTARAIHREAVRALAAAEKIRTNTAPIWALQDTHEVADAILETVDSIREKGGALSEALEAHAAR
jgi:hypothetical protein